MGKKHPNITNISEVEPTVRSHGQKFGFKGWRMAPATGGKRIGASLIEIEPGRQAFPNHFHSSNEEAAYVLEGTGLVRIGKQEVEITAGDYIAFPVGPDYSHSIRNNSKSVLRVLCISTLVPVDVVGYPDSKKTAAVAMEDATLGFLNAPTPWVRMLIKNQENVDYYEGEDS